MDEQQQPTSYDRIRALGYEEIAVHGGGKRCGMQWTPWMVDWFTSWSPRNDNNNAEGPWDHWVDLALLILRDPLTAIVRPAAHAAVEHVTPLDLYSNAQRQLSPDELVQRFAEDIRHEESRRRG